MIRFTDAIVLAHTKLRTHRIRTGVVVAVAGLLFGLIAAVAIIAQGVFNSVDSFSDEGLNSRTILTVTRPGGSSMFNEYESRTDLTFVAEVKAEHALIVEKKTAAAKKYSIEYNAATMDPSPITLDPELKQEVVKEAALSDEAVQNAANKRRAESYTPFDIQGYIADYPSARVIQKDHPVTPTDGQLVYMKEGQESQSSNMNSQMSMYDSNSPTLSILDGSITTPFVSVTDFDYASGDIPVIIPYSAAEKLLKLEALPSGASSEEKYNRLLEVRNRVGEITATYCYRNSASQSLLSEAVAQQAQMKASKDYKPSIEYSVPDKDSCGAVTVVKDSRTNSEKQFDQRMESYEKEIGEYSGEPAQQLITVRGVGISSELSTTGQWSVAEMVQSIFASWLGYGTWVVPADMLEKVPAGSRPEAVFTAAADASDNTTLFYGYESYLVEFDDKNEARTALNISNANAGSSSAVFAYPFGSGVLLVDEMRGFFEVVLLWAFGIIGIIASIILASLIGRTVSEGRRESSIFRAIGASRADISSVYGVYVTLLALRVVLFTAIMGMAVALVIEILYWKEATFGARQSFAASDTSREFHLFGVNSEYLLWVVAVIIVVSIIASVVPILLGARRNPIKDMRNDA